MMYLFSFIFFSDLYCALSCLLFLFLALFFLMKKRLFLGLLAIFLCFALAALSKPYYIGLQRVPFTLVHCLDSSASLSLEEKTEMLTLARRLSDKAKQKKIHEEFVTFGTYAQRQESFPLDLPAQDKTSLPEALNLALAIIQKHGGQGRIALFTDASGVSLADTYLEKFPAPVFVYHPPERKDWQFLSLKGEDRHKSGAKIPFKVLYSSNFEGEIHLAIWANERIYYENTFPVKKTPTGILLLEGPPLDEDQVYFHAKATGDSRLENNCAYAFSQKFSSPPILLYTHHKNSLLERAMEIQYIPVETTENPWTVVWNHPLVLLENPSMKEIQRHERKILQYLDKGGSIVLLNAGNLNAPWIPVVSLPQKEQPKSEKPYPKEKQEENPDNQKNDKPQEIELKTAALVFVIDRSGSMAGEKLDLARKSILASIGKLWEKDIFGIIAFDHEANWIVPVGRGTDIRWVSEKILQIAPGGSTKIAPAVEKALSALANVPAHIKHVILLSDGQDDNGVWARYELSPILQKMQESKITITTIGIGGEFDADLMAMIARIGKGEFHIASGYNQIPLMMFRDIDRVLQVRQDQTAPKKKEEKPLTLQEKPLPKSTTEPSQKQENQAPVLCTSQNPWFKKLEPFPPVAQYQMYQLKKEARQELAAEGNPLFVHWQWSLGKVAVWGANTEAWADWTKYTIWWSGVVNFFSQQTTGLPFLLEPLPRKSDYIPYTLIASDAKGNPLESPDIISNFPFVRQTPVRWYAPIPRKPKHEWQRITLEIQQEKKTLARAFHAFASGYSDEEGDLKINKILLQSIAQKSLGGFLPQDEEKLLSYNEQESPFFLTEYILWIALGIGFGLILYWKKIN